MLLPDGQCLDNTEAVCPLILFLSCATKLRVRLSLFIDSCVFFIDLFACTDACVPGACRGQMTSGHLEQWFSIWVVA